MVSTKEALESKYLTVVEVKNATMKRLVVLGEGSYQDTDFGRRLTIPIEFNGRQKEWRPNRESVNNLQSYGEDSKSWVGKVVLLSVQVIKGKEAVIAFSLPNELATSQAIPSMAKQ